MGKIREMYKKWSWGIRLLIILVFAIWINSYIPDLKIPADTFNRTILYNMTYNDVFYDNITFIDLNTAPNEENLYSLDFNKLLLKILYLNHWKGELCFKKNNLSEENTYSVSYNKKNYKNVTNTNCFGISKKEDKITFDMAGNFYVIIPKIEPLPPVNKSECIPETIDETSHTCLTEAGIKKAQTEIIHFDGVETYVQPKWFYRKIKILWIFLLSGIFIWNITRVYVLIKEGLTKK
jgi:hypothetical protein